ncbi:hypothetical protein EGH21_22225 [Halomicroarcula sp. F13]|uniref:Uncharacterized protein n=1 Tax=Haloarcula rubra TaxID=2487747 RepID=A0AAW4PZQ7_9EURY|nr:hypothetical protein [Halomicroarcula rubra]MBX0325737.1 hypothetical protein [Halomicroarcula rubra]
MTDTLSGTAVAWKQAYVDGDVGLSELEAALEQYFETGAAPDDPRVVEHVPTLDGQTIPI